MSICILNVISLSLVALVAAVVSLGGIFWPTTGDYIDAMTEIEEREKARRRESGMR